MKKGLFMAVGLAAFLGAANVAHAACTVSVVNGGLVRQCSEQTQVGPGTQSGGNFISGLPAQGGSSASAPSAPSIPSMPSFDLSSLDSLFRQPQLQASAPSIPSIPSLPSSGLSMPSSASPSIPSFSMPKFDFGNLSSLFSYLQ